MAAMNITRGTPDNQVRINATYWKVFAIPSCRAATINDDPRVAMLDAWTLSAQFADFFKSDAGAEVFGSLNEFARSASDENLRDIEAIAALALGSDKLGEARRAVYAFAEQNPLDSSFSRRSIRPGSESPGATLMQSTIGTLFMPLRSIGNMDKTALAIQEVASAGEKMNLTARYLPSEMRWNVEMLLYQLNDLESVSKVQAQLQSMTQSVDAMPARLREESIALLDGLDKRQANLQVTVQRAQEAIAEAKAALPPASDAASRIGEAGKELKGLVTAINDLVDRAAASPDEAPADDARPFDVNDWARAADSFTKAAAELRQTLREVDALSRSDVPRLLLESTDARARDLVRYITLCAASLILLTAVTMVVTRRLCQRRTERA
jgi:hypothetical protein